eukprot:5512431-Amphidinium_carterae.1
MGASTAVEQRVSRDLITTNHVANLESFGPVPRAAGLECARLLSGAGLTHFAINTKVELDADGHPSRMQAVETVAKAAGFAMETSCTNGAETITLLLLLCRCLHMFGEVHMVLLASAVMHLHHGCHVVHKMQVLHRVLAEWEKYAGGDAHAEPTEDLQQTCTKDEKKQIFWKRSEGVDLPRQAWAALLQLRGRPEYRARCSVKLPPSAAPLPTHSCSVDMLHTHLVH